jgi:DNA replication and repair protein RecF
MHLTLTNYRCFDTASFEIPDGDFIIMDNNGSGKTSILSAFYSLHTGKPLPNTKFPEYLQVHKDYFGISTDDSNWFINGKIGPSGRLSTKYSNPNEVRNTVLTYQPNDNYWLQQSRSSKLNTLDQIIGQTNSEYLTLISSLDRICKNKLALLKESNLKGTTDQIMCNFFGQEILNLSKKIWLIRWAFLDEVKNHMEQFTDMIQSQITDWQIQIEITASNGNKINIHSLSKFEGRYEEIFRLQNLDNIDFEQLWQRELACEKVLFGANRDDFNFIKGKLKIEHVLSRGEIRLFVLWVKKLGIEPSETIWLLDDIFNELDDEREQFLMSNIFMGCKQIIATGTRCSLSNLEKKNIQSLRSTNQT